MHTNQIKLVELKSFTLKDLLLFPKLIGLTINVHNGNSFNKLLIKENMLEKLRILQQGKDFFLKEKNKWDKNL